MKFAAELRTICLAAYWLPVIRRRLRTRSYATVVEGLERRATRRQRRALQTGLPARRVGQIVNGVANRLPMQLDCVPRTLTASYLLRKEGVVVDMPIGVRVGHDGGRTFHTWAEVDGVPVNDRRDIASKYHRFGTDLPQSGVWE